PLTREPRSDVLPGEGLFSCELETGIEPATTCLQDRCATVAPLQRRDRPTDRPVPESLGQPWPPSEAPPPSEAAAPSPAASTASRSAPGSFQPSKVVPSISTYGVPPPVSSPWG